MKTLYSCFMLLIFVSHSFGQSIELWGATSRGGAYDFGAIFSIDTNGNNFEVKQKFNLTDGDNLRYDLTEGPNGILYGYTYQGGIYNTGTLYMLDPATNYFQKLYDFQASVSGSYPVGKPMLASDGKLYGATAAGGPHTDGTLFSFDLATQQLTVENYDNDNSNNNGYLIQASDGLIYGTKWSGTSCCGTIFSFNISNGVYSILHRFTSVYGNGGFSGFMEASNGKLYAVTSSNPNIDNGILIEFDRTTQTITRTTPGGWNTTISKWTAPIEITGGYLLAGTTGSNFRRISLATLSIYSKSVGTANASRMMGRLLEWQGKIIGTSYDGNLPGGGISNGHIFEYQFSNNSFTKTVQFNGLDGKNPVGGIMLHSSGRLFGTTWKGGKFDQGTIYEYHPQTGTHTKLIDIGQTSHGNTPHGSVLQASNGSIYCHASLGGQNDHGTLLKYNFSREQFAVIHNFDSSTTGKRPFGDILEYQPNQFIGITYQGGSGNCGMVYLLNSSGQVQSTPINASIGCNSFSGFIKMANGDLLATATAGGVSGDGTIFKFNPINSSFIKVYDFGQHADSLGTKPIGQLHLAKNGKLYGLANSGGSLFQGVIYEFDYTNSTYRKLHDFDGPSGSFPIGNLIEASDSVLYGMTEKGGSSSDGTIFSYNINSETYSKQHDFNKFNDGYNPLGSLIKYNNKLYGMIRKGGAGTAGKGMVFSFDLSNGTLFNMHNFNSNEAASPTRGHMSVVSYCHNADEPDLGGLTKDLCLGDSIEIRVSPNSSLGDAAMWVLVKDSCNGARLDSSINGQFFVQPNQTTTYYVKAIGNCVQNSACAQQTITVSDTIDARVIMNNRTLMALDSNLSYQWINCNTTQLLASDTNQTFIPTADGTYAVILSNGVCVDTSACFTIIGVGIEDFGQNNDIDIFPNPTNNHVTIQTEVNINSIEVRRMDGRIIQTKWNSQEQILELPKEKGIYFIEIESENGARVSKKVIKI